MPIFQVVRPWVSLVLVVGAVALTIHHVMGHRHFVAIPLLLVPGLVLGVTEYRFRQDVARFSQVASQIAGRPVTMECQRLTGALVDVTSELGYVEFDSSGAPRMSVGSSATPAIACATTYTATSATPPSSRSLP